MGDVRRDEGKPASSSPTGQASAASTAYRVGCDRILLPRKPKGLITAGAIRGIRRMSGKRKRSAYGAPIIF
jgi:hypothetical protein